MYVKVYISGVEMSQKIHFWHKILLKWRFLKKMAKKEITFLVKKFLDSLQNTILS